MEGTSQGNNRSICTDVLRQAPGEVVEEAEMEKASLEIIGVFRDLVGQLWGQLVLFIGDMATAAIFQSARREVMQTYAFLKAVNVDREGVCLDQLRGNPTALNPPTARAGFLAFLDEVVALLTDLTGDILVRNFEPLVEQFRAELGEGGSKRDGEATADSKGRNHG